MARFALTGVLCACTTGALSFPDRTVTPDVVGRIEAASGDPENSAGWTAVLADREVPINPREDRGLQRAAEGDLLLFGTEPDRWFIGADPSDDDGCYLLRPTKGYDQPEAVVLVYSEWPEVGIRLPKAPGFDADDSIVHDPEGRPQYDGISGITLCADEQGRLTGLAP